MTLQTEGIILKSFPYRDYDQIISLYTRDYGLITLLIKWGRGKKSQYMGSLIPLTQVDVVFSQGRGEMGRCLEISPLHQLTELRSHYSLLEKGCEILNVLKETQLPGKPSQALYQLALSYLKKMHRVKDPRAIVASFKLKLMRHDGLLHLHDRCLTCDQLLESWYLADRESYCSKHAPHYSQAFDMEDALILTKLATTLSFEELKEQKISEAFYEKVQKLFCL